MPRRLSHPFPFLAIAAVAATLPAQIRNNAGFLGEYLRFECDPQTGNTAHLGVCCDPADGHVFVSARALPSPARPHLIYEFDARGRLVGSFPQPAVHDASAWGMRDLEWDGQSILGGSEAGISVLTRTGALRNQILTANGPRPIVQPIVVPGVAVHRALCLDPTGNGGNGSLYVADYQSAMFEVDLAGNVLRSWPNSGWSAYGLCRDPVTGHLWVNSAPDAGRVAQLDRTSMLPTGRAFPMAMPGQPFVTVQGGLSAGSPTAGQHEPWGTVWSLLHLVQGSPDVIAINRVHLFPGKIGWHEVGMVLAVNGSAPSAGPLPVGPGDTLHVTVSDPMGLTTGWPCWLVWNLFADATTDAYTDLDPVVPGFGVMTEHRSRNGLSTPPAGGFLLSNAHVGVGYALRLPPSLPFTTGDPIRLQAIYLEPLAPQGLASSNEAFFVGR